MIKTRIALAAAMLLGVFDGAHAEGKNYTLTIGNSTYDLNLDEDIKIKLPSGAEATARLAKKEFGTFSREQFSFEYPNSLSVAETLIDKGIHQYLVSSALGTMVIVQHYESIGAEGLSNFMFETLSKDDKKLGAKIKVQDATKTLSDGTTMKGLTATVKSKKDEDVYEIYALDLDDGGGVLAISRYDSEYKAKDVSIIERFWASLRLKD